MKRFTGEVFYSTIKGKLTARAEFFDEKKGKRRQIWRTVVTTKKDAKEKVINAVEKILNDANPHDYTFSDFAEYYKTTHAVPAKFVDGVKVEGKKTWQTIHYDIGRLVEFFGSKKIRAITRDDILAFKKKRFATPVKITYFEKAPIPESEKHLYNSRKKFIKIKKEKVSQRAIASVNHELRTFSAMMRVAWENHWLDYPFNMSKVISAVGEGRRERIPTDAEFETLLAEASKEPRRWHMTALMLLMSDVGARPVEALSLHWEKTKDSSYVDLINKTVTLVSDKGKNRRTDTLFMTTRLFLALMRLPRNHKLVFGGIKSVKTAWGNIKKKTGLDIDLYAIRHYYSVRVDALLISDTFKMKLTRHSQRKTADRYRHYTDDDLKAAAEQLD